MDDAERGAELLAILSPVRVESMTDDLTKHAIAKVNHAIRDAVLLVQDPHQSLSLMICVLSITAAMVGGAAAAMLDMPDTESSLREGKRAALACVLMLSRDRGGDA